MTATIEKTPETAVTATDIPGNFDQMVEAHLTYLTDRSENSTKCYRAVDLDGAWAEKPHTTYSRWSKKEHRHSGRRVKHLILPGMSIAYRSLEEAEKHDAVTTLPGSHPLHNQIRAMLRLMTETSRKFQKDLNVSFTFEKDGDAYGMSAVREAPEYANTLRKAAEVLALVDLARQRAALADGLDDASVEATAASLAADIEAARGVLAARDSLLG